MRYETYHLQPADTAAQPANAQADETPANPQLERIVAAYGATPDGVAHGIQAIGGGQAAELFQAVQMRFGGAFASETMEIEQRLVYLASLQQQQEGGGPGGGDGGGAVPGTTSINPGPATASSGPDVATVPTTAPSSASADAIAQYQQEQTISGGGGVVPGTTSINPGPASGSSGPDVATVPTTAPSADSANPMEQYQQDQGLTGGGALPDGTSIDQRPASTSAGPDVSTVPTTAPAPDAATPMEQFQRDQTLGTGGPNPDGSGPQVATTPQETTAVGPADPVTAEDLEEAQEVVGS